MGGKDFNGVESISGKHTDTDLGEIREWCRPLMLSVHLELGGDEGDGGGGRGFVDKALLG